jgi:hypothetical protein
MGQDPNGPNRQGGYQHDARFATLQEQAHGALVAHAQISGEPSDRMLDDLAAYQQSLFSSPGVEALAAAILANTTPFPDADPPLDELEAWREALHSVDNLAVYRIVPTNLVIGNTAPVFLRLAEMTASGFRLTRVQPVLGRYLTDADERADAPPVAVIGHDLWQGRLGGRPDVIGTVVQLGTTRYTIVGVMPKGFAFPINNEMWTPWRSSAAVLAGGVAGALFYFDRPSPEAATLGVRGTF